MESAQGKQQPSSVAGTDNTIGNQPANNNTPNQSTDANWTTVLQHIYDKYGWQKKAINQASIPFLKTFAKINSDADDSFSIAVLNGTFITWHKKKNTNGQLEELILGQKENFGMSDARAIIALAAVRGWQKIDVQGSEEQQDMLWLAAKEQGLEVGNHIPKPGSPAEMAWKQYQEQQAVQTPAASPEAVTPAVSDNDTDGRSSTPAPDKDTDDASTKPKGNQSSSFFTSGDDPLTSKFNEARQQPAPAPQQQNRRQNYVPRRGTPQL